MKSIKDELQNIILGDEQAGGASQLKKIQSFLRRYAQTGDTDQEQQRLKNEEAALLTYVQHEGYFYTPTISQSDFISEGAEQRVYRLDDTHVLKTNSRIFYEKWLDYFNSLLIHNFFFPATVYDFLGFKMISGELHAVVRQEFIVSSESTDLTAVKQFLEFNGFRNSRNNDYINPEVGLIFEDLHDENVLTNDGILFFIDTIFYLLPTFSER